MTRDLTAPNAAAASAEAIAPVLFAKLEFDGGDVLVHSALGEIAFGGDTYTGVGALGNVGAVDEDSELSRSVLQVILSGIPPELLATFLGDHYQGRPATLFLGYRDIETMQLVDAPAVIFRGRMDSAEIARGKDASITLAIESRFAAWDKPRVRRYNNADQQSRFPGDRGLEFVEQTTDKQIDWGR